MFAGLAGLAFWFACAKDLDYYDNSTVPEQFPIWVKLALTALAGLIGSSLALALIALVRLTRRFLTANAPGAEEQ